MKRIIFYYLLIGLMINTSIAFAASVGDHVYVVTGSGSDARVWDGTVIVVGDSRSKIDWNYKCSDCNDWVYNSDIYYSSSSAQAVADKMDSEHTSVGEAAGVAVGVGLLGIINAMTCASQHSEGCTLDGKPLNAK